MFNPPNLKIDHVHLNVSDLEKSLQFYESILGFNIARKEHKTALLSASLDDSNSGSFLVALSESDNKVLSITQNRPKAGLYHFAINLNDHSDLRLLKDHFSEFNIGIDEQLIESDMQFVSSFYAYDSDGIQIQFLHNNS